MKEAINSSETAALTRATQRNMPEDTILHSHRRENLKSYTILHSHRRENLKSYTKKSRFNFILLFVYDMTRNLSFHLQKGPKNGLER
jgi:hypothetical protein